MIQQLFDNHVFLYIMGGLCGLGVFLKCFLLVVYNKLIAASENMNSTKKNWLKNMKLRFESSYQLQLGVNDVDIYVDKYVSKIKYGGLLLSTWENISGQTIGLCLLTGSFAGIIGFVYECGQSQVLFTFFAGAWTAIIVNIVDNVVNISAHRQMLRYNLIDYFENNLKVRMEQEVFHPEVRKKYQREYFEDSNLGDNGLHSNQEKKKAKLQEKKNRNATNEELFDMEEIIPEILTKSELKQMEKMKAKEMKRNREQDKLDAIQAKKQAKYDKKQAKKQEKIEVKQAMKQAKIDAIEEKKQAKLDEIEAKKQAKREKKQVKIDKKEAKKQEKLNEKQAKVDAKEAKRQAVLEAKRLKKQRKDEVKEAKERAELEAIQAKRREREEEKEREKENRAQLELARKQKAQKNNKAYIEKMRLMEDKEREAKKREEMERKKQESKSRVEYVNELKANEELENYDDESCEEDRDALEMTAISKEEDLLIEEVLKDFLL